MTNSVNISSLLTVSFYWYLLIISVSIHGSLHVNMNKNLKILIFGTQNVDFQIKNVQNFMFLSKFPKFPFSILKFPKIVIFDTKISKIPIFRSLWIPISGSFYTPFYLKYWQLLIFWFYWQPTSFFKYHWKWYFQPRFWDSSNKSSYPFLWRK